MSFAFKNILIENKEYPSIILWEDKFFWWKNPYKTYKTEIDRINSYHKTLEISYKLWVRWFCISPQISLINTLKNFKTNHPDIICIANPHASLNYYYNWKSMWQNEIWNSLTYKIHNKIQNLWVENNELFWKINNQIYYKNIYPYKIEFNELEFKNTIKIFKSFCDFYIVWNLCLDALILLWRIDIINKQINIIRDIGAIPIGISELWLISLEKLEKLDLSMIFLNIQNSKQNQSIKNLKNYSKLITAYRAFSSNKKDFNILESINDLRNYENIKSIVIWVENHIQAQENFSKLSTII